MMFPFPLGIQLTLPENYAEDRGFSEALAIIAEKQFSELELNIADTSLVDPAALAAHLRGFGLSLTRLATGATAKRLGLSLSSEDASLRRRSIARCADLARYAWRFPSELVVGFLKGMPERDPVSARERFRESLAALVRFLGPSPSHVLIEATNRRESSIANTMKEAADLISGFEGFGFLILGDTYHMNAEGEDIMDSLARYLPLYHSLHISDDNRLFPGLGGIDFAPIFRRLEEVGYTGSLVIEGSNRGSLIEDLRESIECLHRAFGA